MSDVLVVEISGKRPGDKKARPTEKFKTKHDHLIISNNSEGYVTDWDIVNVPAEYVEFYKARYKHSDSAWYAPMNRSYAIKYAREHGYKYLVQMDDNIKYLELSYMIRESEGYVIRYRKHDNTDMLDDYIDMMVAVMENTNAGVVGCDLASMPPDHLFLGEQYCYSLFMFKLSVCPDAFHGDFEDDIEYRLKCAEMGIPEVMVKPLKYSKTGQKSSKDESGNRAAYTAAGLKRGEHMSILHGDVYSCGYTGKTKSVKAKKSGANFKHKIKPFKLGVFVKDRAAIDRKMQEILTRNAVRMPDKMMIKVRGSESGGVEGEDKTVQ